MRQTSDKLILTYDNDKFYTIDSLFVIYEKESNVKIKYLLALLNSKLLNRQYQKLNPEKGRVFAQVKIDFVNELPIPKIEEKDQQPFVALVDRILELKKDDKDTQALENEIDALVYRLYDLTADEIAIVEGKEKL